MNTTSSNPAAILPYQFEKHEVRALTIDGDPWFVAKDVCAVLDLGTEQIRRLDDDEKGLRKVQTPGGTQEMAIISESGLYTLIIRSNKPQAKPFRKWVTAEVLPSIRKTGGYAVDAGAGGNRTDIFHHRGPRSASGLDIRYTLDLTKIITNPRRPGLDLLERLTGVMVTDLVPEQPRPLPVRSVGDQDELVELFASFFAESVEPSEHETAQFSGLYRAFIDWCHRQGLLVHHVAGLRDRLLVWIGQRHPVTCSFGRGWETVHGLSLIHI